MSATSNSPVRPASVTGMPEGARSWVAVALVRVAVAACAFVFSGHVVDGAGQASLVGP
jgi:hypothetical protein